MLGIIGLHVLNWGGINSNERFTAPAYMIQVIAIICYWSVDIFAILTGYLYYDKKAVRPRESLIC